MTGLADRFDANTDIAKRVGESFNRDAEIQNLGPPLARLQRARQLIANGGLKALFDAIGREELPAVVPGSLLTAAYQMYRQQGPQEQ